MKNPRHMMRLIRFYFVVLVSVIWCPMAHSDEAEQEKQFLALVAEDGLEVTLIKLTALWSEKFPMLDPYEFESGAKWTVTDGAAWGDTMNWFFHSDLEDPNTGELLLRKLDQQCVESGRIYVRNGVKIRYHIINSQGIPVWGFSIDKERCDFYTASR